MGGNASYGIATGAFVEERDDWPAAIAKAVAGGWRFLELTAIDEDRLDSLVTFLASGLDALGGFDRVSVHAPVQFRTSAASVLELLAAWEFDLVLHPDVYRDLPFLQRLGRRVVFENMDVTKSFGRDIDSLGGVFDAHPEAGFCLDVAHVWTNDPTLRLAHELLDRFGDRLRQLHVSGIEPDGTHRPTTPADLERYGPVLERCRDVPWLLESELV